MTPWEPKILLFLDFDGVLHPLSFYGSGLFNQAPELQQLLRDYPEIGVVVHSSWRESSHHSDENLRDYIFYPSTDLDHQYLGTTPREIPSRWESILAWMKEFGYPLPYIIIDDCVSSFPTEARYRLLATASHTGMTPIDWRNLRMYLDNLRAGRPMREPGAHNWKLSWPGNFCIACGMDDPAESGDALLPCPIMHEEDHDISGCKECNGVGMIVDPNFKFPPCPAAVDAPH